MRRKWDLKNKKSFVIVLILAIAVIFVFSLFIYNYSKISKIQYTIEAGSVLQDVDKNYMTIDDDAILKIRWNGSYYLEYLQEKIALGKKIITYNTITGSMKLYGSFYEINDKGKVIESKDELSLANTTDTKFYKLDDREYLLIDRTITSEDGSLEASNYLLVELDKLGNAKLSNNKINLKTITPTILVTSKYTFDIANEILNFGDYDIDLKKIIGSTNEYVKEEEKKTPDDNTDENNTAGNGIGTGVGVGNVVNNNDVGNVTDIGEVMDKVKLTSIIRSVEGLTQIDIDYVIYDPYDEYKSVYVEVIKPGKVEIVYLSKNDTHLTLNGLNPNTLYKLNFIYTTSDAETKELIPYTFETLGLKTKMPEYAISVYKISKVYNTLTYKVNLQSGFSISKVNVNLSFNYDYTDLETGLVTTRKASIDGDVSVNNNSYVLGTMNLSGYSIDEDTILKLTVISVESSESVYPINSSYSFKFGR